MHKKPRVFDRKLAAALQIVPDRPYHRALVVGCGSGREAVAISEWFNCRVDGIDISSEHFKTTGCALVDLHVMDASSLSFPDDSFDLLYSFHALEHIDDLEGALAEMRRVLKPGASIFIGTPNKTRIIGYLGSAASFRDKIRWNLADLTMRLTGRWENRLGAHAGFTASELRDLMFSTFGSAEEVTLSYYENLYARHLSLIRSLARTGLGRVLFPAVYFIAKATARPTSSVGSCD